MIKISLPMIAAGAALVLGYSVLVALLGISRRRYAREVLGKLHRQMKRSIPAVALPLVQVIVRGPPHSPAF